MEKNKITVDQVSRFNKAFHTLWLKIMTSRPESKSDKLKGLTFSDMHVISMAYEEPDIILKDIRERLRLPQTTLSSIVAKLEKKGFVQRIINPRDYRSFSLKITPRGEEMMTAHMELDDKQNRHILQSLEPEEREAFIRLFAKVADKFNF
ncbi:MAG: MarR family transcriptional regulator [Desulfobacter sp.]|nr:MarR family transcriptional regulator [Desulfobacter sp.]WDP85620.1 MAG: MarR family transcriptional regulator [Desulfobacter sp.]